MISSGVSAGNGDPNNHSFALEIADGTAGQKEMLAGRDRRAIERAFTDHSG
jgi:hypothetical protein